MTKKILITLIVLSFINLNCASKPIESNNKDEKYETLASQLAKSQARIEELDAKIAALNDKIEKLNFENQKQNTKPKLNNESEPLNIISPSLSLDDVTQKFKTALEAFQKGEFEKTISELKKITESTPEHILAGSAQYYIGESYFAQKNYKQALVEYEKVLTTYGSSPRVATAMIRIAQCYESLGDKINSEKMKSLAQSLFSGSPALDLIKTSSQPSSELEVKNVSKNYEEHEEKLNTKNYKEETQKSKALELEPMGVEN
jgi:TolA-binding protein